MARWAELKAAFAELSELPHDERERRLGRLARTDPELHEDLSSLLRADERGADLLRQLEMPDVPATAAPDGDPIGLIGRTVSHFRILEVLGAGGVGVVYRAHDDQLGRVVALKFLLPHHAQDAAARERFVREARSASTLDHPNICTIYEAGVAENGAAFMAMACYAGETLRTRLQRGPLPIDEAIDIATQMLRGLDAAHAAGIEHRDLKPANLLLSSDGVVRILDFGLARARGVSDLTGPGLPPGTTAYMSPEQFSDEEVDHRTDLWSAGVLMYEMLAGRPPFRRGHELSTLHSILHDEPTAPSASGRDVPQWLDAVVLQLLEKDPADRYGSARDVLADLAAHAAPPRPRRRSPLQLAVPVVLVLVAAAGLLVAAVVRDRAPSASATVAAAETASIAVLPFTDASPGRDQAHFSDGIAEEILNALHASGTLRVSPRASAFAFRDTELPPAGIAARLGVRNLLRGEVRRRGDGVRITASLVDAESGHELWSSTYDTTLDGLTGVQQSIVRAAAAALHVPAPVTDGTATAQRPVSGAAYELFLYGQLHVHLRTAQDLVRATHYFEASIARDSTNARAFAGLASAYAVRPILVGEDAAEAVARVEAAAARASALDPQLADPYASLGYVYHQAWRWADAERAFRRALELDPNHSSALQWYGEHTVKTGRAADAEAALRRAVALDPLSVNAQNNLGLVLLCSGRTEEAIAQFRHTLELDPGFAIAHLLLFRAQIVAGDLDGALATRRIYDRLMGQPTDETERVIRAIQGRGDRSSAVALVEEWAGLPPRLGDVVLLAPLLGERDIALTVLERAFESRHPLLTSLRTPLWGGRLRDEPRYQRLVRRMEFPAR